MERQIVAFGGEGFLMEPRNARLDRYVLELSGKPVPRVCFVPTASGSSQVDFRVASPRMTGRRFISPGGGSSVASRRGPTRRCTGSAASEGAWLRTRS
ncbi:MAG TPA: Type 1 glutamine amidotransferase-like domain-containing protein [Tepidisphaeraceae bacterium]|jgi:hypothetical protein